MQILEILLYNHDGEISPMVLHPGELNIITGRADTGKTAVLEIIHYCLGDEDDIRIPRMITNVVAWFAVRVAVGELELFIARPSPDHPDTANNAVALNVGPRAIPPLDDLDQTTTVDGLNAYLSRVVGIEENVSVLPEPTRPELEARFRHALFYCFQRQYEIANPELLFHRQGQPYIKTTIGTRCRTSWVPLRRITSNDRESSADCVPSCETQSPTSRLSRKRGLNHFVAGSHS